MEVSQAPVPVASRRPQASADELIGSGFNQRIGFECDLMWFDDVI